ncbi:hypothetical protein ACFL3S_01320 [Gemmatimonadota bacterium]
MRLQPTEALPWEGLLALPVHVLVREYPELLPVLLDHGISVEESGGTVLRDVVPVEDGLERECLQALAWRVKHEPRP